MTLLRPNFAEVIPDLKKDEGRIKETLEALSLREGERYISLGIGRNQLPFIIALQGIDVTGVDISPEALAFQMQMLDKFRLYLIPPSSFAVYNLNFDDPYTGTKPISGFVIPDYDKIDKMKRSFNVVECVYFNHREGEADLAQILLNLAKPDARFFVSSPLVPFIAYELIKWATLESDRPQLEVVATNLYVSTSHSAHYGVVLRPSSQI